MKTSTISDTKNQLSALIETVKHGETVLILDRSVPVARLEPVLAGSGLEGADHLAQLERQGLLRRGKASLSDSFLKEKLPALSGKASIVKALLDERASGR
ncbi:MAG: type II toxin-antitoxin system Phd/YefM family antitoxin [Planctomycetes bacterium]|nr:type II toxin-antitoxin system Phd/YefM family antitoxin [Planctomycetota bacterium]